MHRFIVQVFDNGKLISTLKLSPKVTKKPTTFFHDVNNDGIPDLVIQFFKGKAKVQVAFSGLDGKQLF
jgi:hypothetical protein